MDLDDKARALLEGKNFPFIATTNRDDSPQVTPTWGDTDGKFVLINTRIGTAKYNNVKRDPRVAVSVFEMTNPYKRVLITGRVVEFITGKVAEDNMDKLEKRYRGNDKYPHREEKRVLLKIKPERITHFCQHCGTPADSGTRLCRNCGKPLE